MTNETIKEELSNGEIIALHQLADRRFAGVWAGDLIDKEAARSLIRKGYAEGSHPSGLKQVYISKRGRDWLAAVARER